MKDQAQPNLLKVVAPYTKAQDQKAWIQVLNSFLPFFFGCWLMYQSLSVNYALTLLLALPVSGLVLRIFIIQHDCGHGSFFRSKKMNLWMGRFCSIFTFTPYAFWQRQHALHHATSGNLSRRGDGDTPTLTIAEYKNASWLQRTMYHFHRNRFLLPVIGGPVQFFIIHRFPWYIGFQRYRSWMSVGLTNLVLACIIGLTGWGIGFIPVIQVYVPVLSLAALFGTWMFYIQHQFEGSYWAWEKEWDLQQSAMKGASFYKLPKVLQWFTGNIGFHHIHHLSSRIPNYELERCYRDNPALWVEPLTFWKAFKVTNYDLWDERQGRLVSFREAMRTLSPNTTQRTESLTITPHSPARQLTSHLS